MTWASPGIYKEYMLPRSGRAAVLNDTAYLGVQRVPLSHTYSSVLAIHPPAPCKVWVRPCSI